MANARSATVFQRRVSVVLALLLAIGVAVVVDGRPAGAAKASPAKGSAFAVSAPDITIFGGAQPAYGPTPAVTLPARGSAQPVTASNPSESVVYGPATLFTSGADSVSTQGSGSTSVTSTATLTAITNAHGETMTADSLSSTCTANGTNSASTTVTNGVVATMIDDTGTVTATMAVPTNPTAGFSINGTLVLSASDTETFTWVFNEQTTNADGSITVTAAHYILHGPTAKGDVYLAQSICGAMQVPATTTTTKKHGHK